MGQGVVSEPGSAAASCEAAAFQVCGWRAASRFCVAAVLLKAAALLLVCDSGSSFCNLAAVVRRIALQHTESTTSYKGEKTKHYGTS